MSSILVNDIFEELKEENKRLLNELSYSKKCLKVLIELKTAFNSHSNEFKQFLKLNEWKKLEKLNEEINKTLFKNDVNRDYTIHENIVNEENVSIKREPNSVINNKFIYGSDVKQIEKTLSNGEENEELFDKEYGIDSPNKCPHCSKSFQFEMRFKIHVNMHENNGVFRCWHNGCESVFHNNEIKAQRHLYRHTLKDDPSKRFKHGCDWPGCEYRASDITMIKRHKLVHQSDDISRMFVCHLPQCGQKFKQKCNLDNHLKRHMTDQRVECDICGKSYKNDISLYSHKRQQHLKEKHLVCDHMGCQYRTNYLSYLKQHKISHSTDTPFACDVEGCDKRFPTKDRLKDHKVRHSKEYNCKCTFDGCEKTFRHQMSMKDHCKRHHTHRELLRCDWPGCEYQTNAQKALKVHTSVHKTERNFICEWPECGKGYKIKHQLTIHMRTHTKDKRFVCKWPGCQFRTEYSSSLYLHRRVHQK